MNKSYIYVIIILLFNINNLLKADEKWKPVPPVDLSAIKVSEFGDDELDIPYYLYHFHTVINSVVESGENRGFINIPVWRKKSENIHINARIMENILSFVWFYTQQRAWNPYYGMTEVRVRIEAAIDYLNNLQLPNGMYPDVPQKYHNGGMASTAFITKFMGEALVLLSKGPKIDNVVFERAKKAQCKAIMELLENDVHYNRAMIFPNQYTNVFAGALAYLSVFQNDNMYQCLKRRVQMAENDIISPAGFFPEAYGVDYDYNLHTHFSNLWMCYNYSQNSELNSYFVNEARAFSNWIQYNSVLDNEGPFTLNAAVETRKFINTIPENTIFRLSPFGEKIKSIRAFEYSIEELHEKDNAERAALKKNWPNVNKLIIGGFDSYSPYAFLHRNHYKWNPTKIMKDEAIASLPYLEKKSFIHQKMHDARPLVFTYIKKPNYYAVFNSGQKVSEQQRYGLGLLWHPVAGTILQSQAGTIDAVWGTMLLGGDLVYEAESLDAGFSVDYNRFEPHPGVKDVNGNLLSVNYPLANRGIKTVDFFENKIDVTVNHKGKFSEYIPLLLKDKDFLTINDNSISFIKNGVKITVLHSKVNKVTSLSEYINNKKASDEIQRLPYNWPPLEISSATEKIKSGLQNVVVIRLDAEDYLKYTFQF